MPAAVPVKVGTSFIVHTDGNVKDTFSRALRCNINAEEVHRQLLEAAPGLKGRVVITKFVDGKEHSTYDPSQTPTG